MKLYEPVRNDPSPCQGYQARYLDVTQKTSREAETNPVITTSSYQKFTGPHLSQSCVWDPSLQAWLYLLRSQRCFYANGGFRNWDGIWITYLPMISSVKGYFGLGKSNSTNGHGLGKSIHLYTSIIERAVNPHSSMREHRFQCILGPLEGSDHPCSAT